jgi:DNA mismatch repair protein MutS
LAWAIVEYIHRIGAKTLFATHYHELAVLENRLEGVKNYHFGIKEENGKIEFDRKIKRGASNESYGIKVAELANLPREIIKRAYEVLEELNSNLSGDVEGFLKEVASIDVVNLTPIQALVELDRVVKRCRVILKL